MPPKKTANKNGVPKATYPDVSEPDPFSEKGDVSDHETRQVTQDGW